MAKIDDVVQHSGVSRSTVFRFLRGDNVRPAARTAILAAMSELQFEPDGFSAHRGETLVISVPTDFRTFEGFDRSISGFMDRAEPYGFHVQLKTGSVLNLFGSGGTTTPPAGVLFLGGTIEQEDEEARRMEEAGVPAVFVNRVFHDNHTSWVSVDHHRAAREAVEYLFDRGFDEVGTWGLPASFRLEQEKRDGYLAAYRARGSSPPDSCLDFDTHGDLEEAVEHLIAQKRLPSAWFAACDEHAMRFIGAIRQHGYSVPDDVSVVGMDDAGQAELMNPTLTTVHFPYRAAGAAAFDILKRLIENNNEDSAQIVLKHRLVVRESCGAQPAAGRGNRSGSDRLPVDDLG
jgi:DNA-binding LacI/PurR family transcriptional regulator